MCLWFRRVVLIPLFCAVFFVACGGPSQSPAPVPGERSPSIPIIQATEAPIPEATLQATVEARGLYASTGNPYILVFGSFPPVPIPARPMNINPLTGLAIELALLQRRPILIRIGNDARVRESFWQAGTSSADLSLKS
jgi:hypothetical protein